MSRCNVEPRAANTRIIPLKASLGQNITKMVAIDSRKISFLNYTQNHKYSAETKNPQEREESDLCEMVCVLINEDNPAHPIQNDNVILFVLVARGE